MNLKSSSEKERDLPLPQYVPIIAFFGTKGGVGKTTIANKFANIITLAEGKPNVLIIDFDVNARGTTLFLTNDLFNCKTIHEYIETRSANIDEAIDVTNKLDVRREELKHNRGKLYLIPSARPDTVRVFRAIADINPNDLLKLIMSLIDSAINKYYISCVLIDCGPTIENPYTAAAVHISDQAFIICENVTAAQIALNNYVAKIKEFYEDFDPRKTNIILNKVRGIPKIDAFAVIPFTIDQVDVSENIADVDQVRLTLLDYYILNNIVKKVFQDFVSFRPDIEFHK